ncbi:EamA family transporter [Alkalinema pantanalense CENA528]|uniref:EamA family transporter n=1 Tax=Alkalinema pantanalense TaxID=1620705 RepID=UPI003D6F669D
MIWLAFAILTAFFESLKDVISKHSLKVVDEYVVAFLSQAFAVVFLLPVLWVVGIPEIQPDYWRALAIGGSINVVSFLLYIKAIKLADLSLTVPLVTLTPLFLLVTSPIIAHEFPNGADAIGVFCIVIGSYVLNLREKHKGYFAPLRALFVNKGSRLMLVVAALWSITAAFDKVGVMSSSPFFWCVSLFSFIALGMLPIALLRSRTPIAKITPHLPKLASIGLMFAIAVGSQMVAVGMTAVTQVIAVKRMSALISVILGHFLFKEDGIRERLLGAAIMVSGVVIMTVF